MPSRTLTALTFGAAAAWNDCAFPDVGYFAMDEAPGISYSYAIAAMNGNMYSGGYTKGNFALVGVTESGDVNPVPSAAIFGDTTTDLQNLYVSETDSTGSMTKSWWFKGSAIQVGQIGHGKQTNSIDAHSGLHKMMDKQHLAVKGGFRQLLDLPDGTQWTSATFADGTTPRTNDNWQVPFVMKLDVSSANGVGAGTTGWAKIMDESHPGGAMIRSVDGDASGNMIVSYQGCATYNATAISYDAYGRPVTGAAEDCVNYIAKLSAADGSEVWKKTIPEEASLYSCRVTTAGSFYCGWSMAAADGTLDFGNSVTVASADSKAGVVMFDTNGDAQWAKATASHSMSDLSVSADGSVLVVIGSSGSYGSPASASRISTDTAAGTEGTVLWTDMGGIGSHGFRGVEVTDDNLEVFCFGQITKEETLTDTNGLETKLKSRGSYEAFVVAYDAADGSGKYAMDGGGTGMEYFFAFAKDSDTHAVYVGGTTRSEYITWGDVTRKNVMYNGQPGENNPDTSSPVGSSKAFIVQIKTGSVTTQSCLNNCNTAYPLQASDVKAGYCYIDRYCYADGEYAPYAGDECRKCESAVNPIEWSAPDTSSMCFIDGTCLADGTHAAGSCSRWGCSEDPCSKCDVAKATDAYSAVAGCKLPSEFAAGCFETDGTMMMTMNEYTDEKSGMQTTIDTMTADMGVMSTANTDLQNDKAELNAQKAMLTTSVNECTPALETCQTDLASCQTLNDNQPALGSDVAIALICAVGALFLIVLAAMIYVIMKERSGAPVFVPVNYGKSPPA